MSSTFAHYSESSGFRHAFFRLANARFSLHIISSSLVSSSLLIWLYIPVLSNSQRQHNIQQQKNKGPPATRLCRHGEEVEVSLEPLSIRNQPLEKCGWSALSQGKFMPWKEPVPIVQQAGWASDRSEKHRKSLNTGIRTPDRPATPYQKVG